MKNAVGTIPMAFFHAQNCPRRSQKSYVFSPTVSPKATAHRFSPTGYPGGIEAALFLKINTFPDRRREVITWRYFVLRKPATTR